MDRKKRKLKALRAKEEKGKGLHANRRLTQGLIFSGALNIALATSLIYYAAKGRESQRGNPIPSASSLVLDLSKDLSLQSVLEDYQKLDFETLTSLLRDKETIYHQWMRRDLALAMLAHRFDFDVERALHGQDLQKESFALDRAENEEVTLFSGLNDNHYKHILSFLKTEEWPYTSFGLFKRITDGDSSDSIKNAFFLSKEFLLIEALLSPCGLDKESLLSLISQGPFSIVQDFADSKPLIQSFSTPLRIEFLSQYLEHASDLAANLILKTDLNYVMKKLSDDKIVALLGLLENRSERTQNFALHIALGSRSDWVKKEACRILYHYCGQEFTEPFNYDQAIHFIATEYDLRSPQDPVQPEPRPERAREPVIQVQEESMRTYRVQSGDCLSKIAKMHKVDIHALKEANHLENDLIRPGMQLMIP